jgi:hypothetical protein
MTGDGFEDLAPRRSEAEAEETQTRLDNFIMAWRASSQSADEALATLQAARNRGHAAMWQLLACMYAIAPQLKSGGCLDARLRDAIEQFPEQAERTRRWVAQDSYDIVLTYALGLGRKHASKKSNWRKTLKQAEENNIPFEEEAFLAWINEVGGEEKARRPEKRESVDLTAKIEGLDVPNTTEGALKLSIPAETDLPGGMCVVLLKEVAREKQDRLFQPVEIITDERSVASTFLKVTKRWEVETRKEMNKLAHEQERERKRQQRIDEHGDRPPKAKPSTKRGRRMGPSRLRRRKSTAPPITDFMHDMNAGSGAAAGGGVQ